jgi:anti-sigma B factor antagonist
MRIEIRCQDRVVFIEPGERVTVESELEFTDAIRQVLDVGHRNLVLDLGQVPYIDSCGLGAIVEEACRSARRRGGDLKLLNVAARNRHLLTITKLLTVFEAYDSAEEAGRSFDRHREGSSSPSSR